MELDPNATYKAAFRALQDKLGRVPTSSDAGWLEISNEYSRSYEEEKRGRVEPEANSRRVIRPGAREGIDAGGVGSSHVGVGIAAVQDSAAGPVDTGFSRQPAPQAHTEDQVTGAREGVAAEWDPSPDYDADGQPWEEPLSRPRTIQGPAETESLPGTADGPSPVSQGARGPAGGILAACQVCGRVWERPARRGRPSFKCEECR